MSNGQIVLNPDITITVGTQIDELFQRLGETGGLKVSNDDCDRCHNLYKFSRSRLPIKKMCLSCIKKVASELKAKR